MSYLKKILKLSLLLSIFLIYGNNLPQCGEVKRVDIHVTGDPQPFDNFTLHGYEDIGTCFDLAQTDPSYTTYYSEEFGDLGPAFEVYSDGDYQSYWINGEAMLYFDTDVLELDDYDGININWPGDNYTYFYDSFSRNFNWADGKIMYDDGSANTKYSDGSIYHDADEKRIYLAGNAGLEPHVHPGKDYSETVIRSPYNWDGVNQVVVHQIEGVGLSTWDPTGHRARYVDFEMTTQVDDYRFYSYDDPLDPYILLSNAEIYMRISSNNVYTPSNEGIYLIIPLDDYDEVVMVRGTNAFATECRIYHELEHIHLKAMIFNHIRGDLSTDATPEYSEKGNIVDGDIPRDLVKGATTNKSMVTDGDSDEEIAENIKSRIKARRQNTLSKLIEIVESAE